MTTKVSLFKNTSPSVTKYEDEATKIYQTCFDMLGACFIDEVYSFEHFRVNYSKNVFDSYLNLVNFITYSEDKEIDNLLKDIKKLNKDRNREFSLEFTSYDKYFNRAKERFEKAYSEGVWMVASVDDLNINKKAKIDINIKRSFDVKTITGIYKDAFLDETSTYNNSAGNWHRVFERSITDKVGNYDVYNFLAFDVNNACGLMTVITDNKIAYIESIAVPPKYQGLGIAGELIAFTTRTLGQRGVEKMVLDTELNSSLEKMYTHIGFKKILETYVVQI